METSNQLARLQAFPQLRLLALQLLVDETRHADAASFLQEALPQIARQLEAARVLVATAERGEWQVVAPSAEFRTRLPLTLLGEALDAEATRAEGNWVATPLQTRSSSAELLVVESRIPLPPDRQTAVEAAAGSLDLALQRLRQRLRQEQQLQRTQAILQIAAQWSQNLEMESLLVQMAEASTRLFQAERASIFLWDKTNHTLVGRPALGVDEDELRVPDNVGVVGQVVQQGEVMRVDANAADATVNRQVDQRLGFQTRTILCAPLRGRHGDILGAFELINKREGNFTTDDQAGLLELAGHAAIALENSQQFKQLLDRRKQIVQQAAEGVRLIGQSSAMQSLRETVERVAATDLALLVLGENGTGKEVVSRMVHYLSRRRDEPFVAVNCAAITETLLESELFGHEKGAFTDARETRAGKFELASGGTLFLDEIGDLSLSGQAKLLRVLEDKTLVRVGGTVPIQIDTRVIAATNQDLTHMVRQKQFREDLYFRLNVVTLQMPPLRERVEDVLLLAEHFLREFSARARRQPPRLTAAAARRLRQHPWPGNVRELRNLMERLAFLTPGDTIDADDLILVGAPQRDALGRISLDLSLADATRQFQIDYIRKQIESAQGNMSDAARRLGLHRSNLYRKMRQLDMPDEPE